MRFAPFVRRSGASLLVVAAAIAVNAEWPSHAQPAAPVIAGRWVGTASGEHRRTGIGDYILPGLGTEPGGPQNQSGEVITTWTARIQLKEEPGVDVKDASGAVVGRLVPLRDDGSTITMSMSGRMSERNHYGDVEHWDYSGGGAPGPEMTAAGGGIFSQGWVYRSLATTDPLADVLPNGSYSLLGSPTMLGGVTVRVTRISAGGSSPPHVNTMSSGGMGVWMGGWALWPWARMTPAQRAAAGFGDGGTSITVEAVRRILAATEPAMKAATDANPRGYLVRDGAMSGTLAQRVKTGLDERDAISSTWHLERRIDVKATLSRANRNWRPLKDGVVMLSAALDPSQQLTGKFRFTLLDVSREKGYAINAGTGTEPDLEFQDGQAGFNKVDSPPPGTWQVETTGTGTRATVTLVARDYGAYARVKAEVNVDGHWYPCDVEGGGTAVSLPRDDDGDHIADSWEEIYGIADQSASDDLDDQPAPTNAADGPARAGDGLSNYEEYRGFVESLTWDVGYPGQKDLFIYDALALGTGTIANTGLRVHLILEDEYSSARVLNFNRGYATTGPQNGLHLMDHVLGADIAGQAYPTVGTPNTVEWVGIDTAKETFLAVGGYFDSLVGHELGHAVNMLHHGDPIVTNRVCAGNLYYIAVPGGQYSGQQDCVMRYNDAVSYEGWDGRCYSAPYQGVTRSYCRSKAGTGVNAGPKRMENGAPLPMAGDAIVGACMDHLMIRGTARNGGF